MKMMDYEEWLKLILFAVLTISWKRICASVRVTKKKKKKTRLLDRKQDYLIDWFVAYNKCTWKKCEQNVIRSDF